MILHRFMSEAEYECLIAGGKLMNVTNHHAEYGKRTTSIGFCFFPEEPDEAIHWLRGCVTTDRCVTLDIPDNLLTESTAIYRDPDNDPIDEDASLFEIMATPCPSMEKKEYSLTEYSLQTARLLGVTDKFAEPRIVVQHEPVGDPAVLQITKPITDEDIERLRRKFGMADVPELTESEDGVFEISDSQEPDNF